MLKHAPGAAIILAWGCTGREVAVHVVLAVDAIVGEAIVVGVVLILVAFVPHDEHDFKGFLDCRCWTILSPLQETVEVSIGEHFVGVDDPRLLANYGHLF